MRPGLNWVGGDLVFVMPGFIHEFGTPVHHESMIRTCDFDEDGSPVRGTGPRDGRYRVHVFLDLWVFYPIQHGIRRGVRDDWVYKVIRPILGFFWGLNCGFPPRDVALYTVWEYRGRPPLAVFRKRGERWVKTYPEIKT